MSYLSVNDVGDEPIELYYEDFGHGRPVVLIHGFPLSGAAWEKQIPHLLEMGLRTITYDRRGFGGSSQPESGYDYDTLAEDLNKLITKLDLRDATLVGHSMGTGEIVRFLGKYEADRIRNIVLIAPIPPFLLKTTDNPEGVAKEVFEEIKESIKADRLAYLTKFIKDFYNLELTMGKLVSEEVVASNWDIGASASAIGTLACVSSWLSDFRRDLPKITLPTLIIQGDADRVLPFEATGKRLHEALRASRLVVIKDGPHGICWTHASEVNRELLEFLK